MDYQTLFTLAFWLGFLVSGLLASVGAILFCMRHTLKSMNKLSSLEGMLAEAEQLAEKTLQEIKELEDAE